MALIGIEPILLTTYLITYHALSRMSGSNIKSSLNHLQLGSDLTAYRALFDTVTGLEPVVLCTLCTAEYLWPREPGVANYTTQ